MSEKEINNLAQLLCSTDIEVRKLGVSLIDPKKYDLTTVKYRWNSRIREIVEVPYTSMLEEQYDLQHVLTDVAKETNNNEDDLWEVPIMIQILKLCLRKKKKI